MNNSQNFSHETDSLDMNVTSFESMVNNLSGRIRKMKLRLQFRSEQQKADFELALKRHHDRDEEEIQLSEDQEQLEEPSKLDETQQHRQIPREQACFPIEQSFEMSILLREKFMHRLNDIATRLNVKFMVIPQKVKILGSSSQRVADAEDEYREMRNNIVFQNYTELSREVYQSRFYKRKLKQSHVELIQILRKYYIWYESHKTGKTGPDQVITEVFHNTKHKIYPLTAFEFGRDQNMVTGQATVVHGGQSDRVRSEGRVTNALVTAAKAQLFQKYISGSLNELESRPEMQVELSEDRKSLLLHLDAEEQFEIQRQTIDQQYQPFKFLFLAFPKQVQAAQVQDLLHKIQEPSFKKIKDKASAKSCDLIWQIHDNMVCVAYWSKDTLSAEEIEKHPLLHFVKSIPQEMYNFKLAVQEMITQPEDEDWCFRFIFEKNYPERVTFIGPKNQTAGRYEEMFKLYLAGKFTAEYLSKNKQEQSRLEASEATIDIVDMSRPVNETSLMMSNVLDLTVNREPADQKNESAILPNELVATMNFKFQNYTFLFREPVEDKSKKYSADIDKIQVMKRSSNPENFENLIKQATTYRYRYTKVRVPTKYEWNLQDLTVPILKDHPQWKIYDRWVSVFAGGKQSKSIEGLLQEGTRVRVFKVEKNNSMLEGYLLMTNLLFLLAEGSSQLPFGQYEVTSFIKRVPN